MINIETDTGTTRIKLLDNPFVNDWKEHFIYMLNNAHYEYKNIRFSSVQGNQDINIIKERSKKLLNVIEELNTMGITFPVSIDYINNEIDNLDFEKLDFMQLLNRIHRYCTVVVRNLHVNKSDGNVIELYWSDDDPYNSKFNIRYRDVEKFSILMQQGNLGVHNIDSHIPTPRKLKYLKEHYEGLVDTFEVQFDFVEPEILDLTEDKKIFFKDIQADYHQYASDSDDYDVWIATDIVGKNYQEAFFDYEDPREWDITQPLGHSAGFHVNLSDPPATLQCLIRSKDMQDWFKEHNLNYKTYMNNYPLGNIVEGRGHLKNIKNKCIVTYNG